MGRRKALERPIAEAALRKILRENRGKPVNRFSLGAVVALGHRSSRLRVAMVKTGSLPESRRATPSGSGRCLGTRMPRKLRVTRR